MQINNQVQLVGFLGMDPDLRSIGNSKMARLSIATDASYRNAKGEYVRNSDWHTLVMWGPVADDAEKMLSKGKKVAVTGKLVNRSYEDKDGTRKYTTEVQVDEFLLLDKK